MEPLIPSSPSMLTLRDMVGEEEERVVESLILPSPAFFLPPCAFFFLEKCEKKEERVSEWV